MIAAILLQMWMLPPTMIPPARFDHPFKGQIAIHWVPDNQIRSLCHGTNTACTFGPTIGHCSDLVDGKMHCATTSTPQCDLWINVRFRDSYLYPLLVRHEQAHCNGWPANHPR